MSRSIVQNRFLPPIVYLVIAGLFLFAVGIFTKSPNASNHVNSGDRLVTEANASSPNLASATFGGGCFWCTEAVYQQLPGVRSVESGYAGGMIPNPSYQEVCSGTTGHAEVVQITYDPNTITYTQLLVAFWQSHDPTTINRQGNDVGTQYRSIILYHNENQKRLAIESIKRLEEGKVFEAPIVTEIEPAGVFYSAGLEHQNFYRFNKNKYPRYCTAVIQPKVEKIRKLFADQLHSNVP